MAAARKILDLSEVTLVDLAVIRFLISCEDEGIELVECPPTCASGFFASAPRECSPELTNDLTRYSVAQPAGCHGLTVWFGHRQK